MLVDRNQVCLQIRAKIIFLVVNVIKSLTRFNVELLNAMLYTIILRVTLGVRLAIKS